MSGKGEKFFDAITHVREDLVEEAQDYKFRKQSAVWRRFAGLAASIVLIVSIGFLAAVPRGCGSGGSGAAPDANTSMPFGGGSDQAMPVDPPSSEGSPPQEVGGEFPGDAPADMPEASDPGDGDALRQFTAIVVEIQDAAILVEPDEYSSRYQVLIPTTELEFPPLVEGDQILVTCTSGPILTTDPPVLTGVRAIEKIEPAE